MITETQRRSRIIRKVSRVPADKLDELEEFISKLEKSSGTKSDVLSLAGSWQTIDEETFQELTEKLIANRRSSQRRKPNRALIYTDILSYFFRGDEVVRHNFEKYLAHYDQIEISIITFYEISSGLRAKNATVQLNGFADFINGNIILPLTEKSAEISAELYASLKQSGNIVDDIDLLIAGIAIENNLTLVTNNIKHFSRIPNLKVENWRE